MMTESPETRASLLIRLKDHRDARAWEEFVGIYGPLIQRLVRGKGVQDADAQELTQQALMAVASAIGGWDPDPARGSFRGWLNRVTRNMLINFLTRAKAGDRGGGGTDFHRLLAEVPAPVGDEEAVVEREYREAVFAWAAERVRPTVSEASWRAFWRTAVEGRPIEAVARECGMTVGGLYAVRSRVMAKLKMRVGEWDADSEGAGGGPL